MFFVGRSLLKLILLIVAMGIAIPQNALAAELVALGKTSWPSFRHDLAQTGVASASLPDKLDKLWEVSLGDQIVATSAIVGDFVYVPCLSGELSCLDRATGAKIWGYKTVDKVEPNSFAPGFKSSPTVTGSPRRHQR